MKQWKLFIMGAGAPASSQLLVYSNRAEQHCIVFAIHISCRVTEQNGISLFMCFLLLTFFVFLVFTTLLMWLFIFCMLVCVCHLPRVFSF